MHDTTPPSTVGMANLGKRAWRPRTSLEAFEAAVNDAERALAAGCSPNIALARTHSLERQLNAAQVDHPHYANLMARLHAGGPQATAQFVTLEPEDRRSVQRRIRILRTVPNLWPLVLGVAGNERFDEVPEIVRNKLVDHRATIARSNLSSAS